MNALYNKKYPKNPLSSKSFKKHLEYYQLQNPVYLDQYSPELLQYAVKSDCDSVWQSIDDQATYTIIKNYIEKKKETIPRLLIRKHKKVSKINVFKGREHGTKSKNLILTGTKGADVKISALFLSPRHRQPPYGVFSYPCLYPPEKCIN